MEINSTFKIGNIICNKVTRSVDPETKRNTIIEKGLEFVFELDIELAENFLLKFKPNKFHVNDIYIAIVSATDIYFVDQEYIYVVTNPQQVMNGILHGYTKLIMLNKISAILDFDFETAIEIREELIQSPKDEEVVDEFETEKEE